MPPRRQTLRKSGKAVASHQKKARSDKARARRSVKERLERKTGQKLKADQEWMLEATSDLEQLSAWLGRLHVQQENGLLPLRVGVLGDGATPDDCTVCGLPAVPDDASAESLYMRLCELECLRSRTTDVMHSIAERLMSQEFLVPVGPSSEAEVAECDCSDCECTGLC